MSNRTFAWCFKGIIAISCWWYGRLMRQMLIEPLDSLAISIYQFSNRLYRHAKRVRNYWDKYMFGKDLPPNLRKHKEG